MYDGAKRVSTLSSGVIGSVVKKGFSFCPFTLNSVLLGIDSNQAPCEKAVCTMNGPDQRVFSFPAKIGSLELYSRTLSPEAKFFWFII